MKFEQMDVSLKKYVFEYYMQQAVYLKSCGKSDQATREKHLVLFESARKHLEMAGCSFKKRKNPEQVSDHLSNIFSEFLYQTQIQEIVLLKGEVLHPPDNLDGAIRTICDSIE